MKKFLSLLLAAMMLLSCASAMATSADNNMTVTIGSPASQFKVDNETKNNATSASQSTDLWLQVDAAGQIDVTVPLVVVFKTNIDGGSADTASNYKITNSSSADLVVTAINVTVPKQTTDDSVPMNLVEYGSSYGKDEYGVQMFVAGSDQTAANGETHADFSKSIKNGFGAGTGTNDEDKYVLTEDKINGGLFRLPTHATSGTAKETPVKLSMATGKLSFVTSRQTANNGGNVTDNGMDTEKGIHLMNIAYTVAIDTSNAVGSDIAKAGIAGTKYTDGTPSAVTYSYDVTTVTAGN